MRERYQIAKTVVATDDSCSATVGQDSENKKENTDYGKKTITMNWIIKHEFILVLVLSIAHIGIAALPHLGRPLSFRN
jgi:hypothetical protein